MSYRDLMDFKSRALQYFFAFSNKDTVGIGSMFADNVGLIDWENRAEGKTETLEVYNKIFNSVDMITVTPFALYKDGNTVIAEILITTNNGARLFVTDILGFDENGLINDVRAYKGKEA